MTLYKEKSKNSFVDIYHNSTDSSTVCAYCGCDRHSVVPLPANKHKAALKCARCDAFLSWIDLPKTSQPPRRRKRKQPKPTDFKKLIQQKQLTKLLEKLELQGITGELALAHITALQSFKSLQHSGKC